MAASGPAGQGRPGLRARQRQSGHAITNLNANSFWIGLGHQAPPAPPAAPPAPAPAIVPQPPPLGAFGAALTWVLAPLYALIPAALIPAQLVPAPAPPPARGAPVGGHGPPAQPEENGDDSDDNNNGDDNDDNDIGDNDNPDPDDNHAGGEDDVGNGDHGNDLGGGRGGGDGEEDEPEPELEPEPEPEPELERPDEPEQNGALDQTPDGGARGTSPEHDPGIERNATREGAGGRKRRNGESSSESERPGKKRSRTSKDSHESSVGTSGDGSSSFQSQLDDDASEPDSELSTDPEDTWPETWNTKLQQLKSRGASPKVEHEFKKIFNCITQIAQELGKDVPRLEEYRSGETPTVCLKRLERTMKSEATGWCVATWDVEIRAETDWRQIVFRRQQKKVMTDSVENGEWPWSFANRPPSQLDVRAWARILGIGRQHGHPESFNGNWTLDSILGQGGYGYAGLWVKVDASNTVIDRMVINDVYFEAGDESWRDHFATGEAERSCFSPAPD